MDYYQSTRPEVDDSGLSGGVSFKLGGQIAVANLQRPALFSFQNQSGGGGQGQTYKIEICVEGATKYLDVFVAGPPYDPE
jgi:hypothetical protein